jgi:hypothetical protein
MRQKALLHDLHERLRAFELALHPDKKRMRAKLKAIKVELRKRMHDPIATTGSWVKQGAARASELFRSLGQPPEPVVVLQPGEVVLAEVPQATQPESVSLLGALHPARGSLLPADQGATPIAPSPLRRQNPREEPGALAAHARDLCGGRGVILVPAATLDNAGPLRRSISIPVCRDLPIDGGAD